MINDIDQNTRFKVGYDEVLWFDHARKDWSGSGARPLHTAIWYPTTAVGETLLTAGAVDDPLFIIGHVITQADLAPDEDCYPVVLMSHGTGGTAHGLGWLGIRFARAGYIAVAVSHHGNTAIEPYLVEGFACWWERAGDLIVALDQLSDESRFSGRLDLARVFAAGFSLGGYTVIALAGAQTDLKLFQRWNEEHAGGRGPREFPDLGEQIPKLLASSEEFRRSVDRHNQSWRDARIKAVFAYAPAPPVRGFTTYSLAEIDVPVGLMVGGADREAPPQVCAVWLHQHLKHSQLTVLEDHVGHYVFLCEATERAKALEPEIALDPSGVNRALVHDQAAAAAIEWFRDADGRSRC